MYKKNLHVTFYLRHQCYFQPLLATLEIDVSGTIKPIRKYVSYLSIRPTVRNTKSKSGRHSVKIKRLRSKVKWV